MRDLVRDVGVHPDNLEFFNVGDLAKKRESMFVHPSDHNFNYLMNALFTPLDMTDYENTFVGYNEVSGALPINNGHLLRPVIEEPWPTNHALVAIESVENRPVYSRSKTHKELQDSKNVEEDEEEEEEEEEGEGEGEEEEAGEEEEEVEEEPAYPPVDTIPHIPFEDKYFMHGENLRNKFNEIELDSFMKLLNVKPHRQW